MTRFKVPSFLLTIVLMLAPQTGLADVITKKLQFPRGSYSTTVEDSVIRGDQVHYRVGAGANQRMEVEIRSYEDNAVFQIYKPGYKILRDEDGYIEVSGQSLYRAGESDDAMSWSGTLPTSGTYLIVVGGTRGNASYALSVSIR